MMMCPRLMRKAKHHSMLGSLPSRFVPNWGLDRLWPSHISFLLVVGNWTKKFQETTTLFKRLQLGIKVCQLLEYLSCVRIYSGSRRK